MTSAVAPAKPIWRNSPGREVFSEAVIDLGPFYEERSRGAKEPRS
jgi:hypothetical protein